MPRSDRPRHARAVPKWKSDKASGRLVRGAPAEPMKAKVAIAHPRDASVSRVSRPNGLKLGTAPLGPGAPSGKATYTRGAFVPRKSHLRAGNKKGVLVAAGVATAAGGGGLAYTRSRGKRGTEVTTSKLYDPFSKSWVEVGKALSYEVTSSREVKALVPTGRNVSHANDLSLTTHRTKRKGAPMALAQYRAGSQSAMTGGGQTFGNRASHVRKSFDDLGASRAGFRGTPMSDISKSSRHGSRLVTRSQRVR